MQAIFRFAPVLLLPLLAAACGEGADAWDTPFEDAAAPYPPADAPLPPPGANGPGVSEPGAGSGGASAAGADASVASASSSSAPAASADAGRGDSATPNPSAPAAPPDLTGILDGLLGANDAGSTAPRGDAASSAWTLDPDSDPACPPEPPPIPIVGGPCLGIYYVCSWQDATGTPYTCTCDWVHWLCI